MATVTAPPPAAAAPALAVRLVVDGAGRRVLYAELGDDAVAFLSYLLAAPVRAAVEPLLQEDPAAAAAGCFGNLLSAGALLLPRAAASASSSSSRAPPPASPASAPRPPAGAGIIFRRLFRCDGLGCRCSDVASRVPGSACPCRSCPTCGGGGATRGTELHFLEACFYRRPDGSAASSTRGGGGRGGDAFYRCHARDGRNGGRDLIQCRHRVTDERGVECPLCHSVTTVAVKLAKPKGGGDEEGSSARPPRAAASAPGLGFAVMDDLSVRPMAEGMSRAALLAELGVADPASVREEVVPFGYKQVLSIIWASLHTKTVLTEVFLRTIARDAPRRRRH